MHPGLLIAAARRGIKQAVLARIADRKLTVQQFWLVVALDENPGIFQAEIAARVHADAPAVSRAFSSLADRGYVRAEADPRDRRRTCVHLTPAGKRLAAELAPVAREIRDAVVAGMSPAEIAAVTAALQRIVRNVERLDRRATSRPPGSGGTTP